jgi:hypothetical protein
MDEYDNYLVGGAEDQFSELMDRAVAAGKRSAFVWWFGEVGRALRDPSRALQVGRPLGQTDLPGGFFRDWQSFPMKVLAGFTTSTHRLGPNALAT